MGKTKTQRWGDIEQSSPEALVTNQEMMFESAREEPHRRSSRVLGGPMMDSFEAEEEEDILEEQTLSEQEKVAAVVNQLIAKNVEVRIGRR